MEMEVDPKRAKKLIDEHGLEGAKLIGAPGVREGTKELEEDSPFPARLHTAFRKASARASYFSVDRVDVQFAAKEACRVMSAPIGLGWRALKRLGRFPVGKPRMVYTFPRQRADAVDVNTGTDWADCPRTRMSTSGRCIMLGKHPMKHWC